MLFPMMNTQRHNPIFPLPASSRKIRAFSNSTRAARFAPSGKVRSARIKDFGANLDSS